jgi:hypothetical protein
MKSKDDNKLLSIFHTVAILLDIFSFFTSLLYITNHASKFFNQSINFQDKTGSEILINQSGLYFNKIHKSFFKIDAFSFFSANTEVIFIFSCFNY